LDPWWLHLLVFVFGYVTCQTFYFVKSTRISLKLIKSSRIIYLLMMTKTLENFKFTEQTAIMHLKESKCTKEVIDDFIVKMNDERESFKKNNIEWIYKNTPSTFRDIIGFDDWPSAMKYLMLHREEAIDFWRLRDD